MPYGRGGAGNIEAQQRERELAAEDIEAQRQFALDSSSSSGDRSEPAQYAHTGRGGAGNFYSPKALASTGSFAGTEVNSSSAVSQPDPDSNINVVSVQQSSIPTIQKVGRGGAGNYEYTSGQTQGAIDPDQEREKQREIEMSAVQNVEEQISLPPKARIPTAGVYRG